MFNTTLCKLAFCKYYESVLFTRKSCLQTHRDPNVAKQAPAKTQAHGEPIVVKHAEAQGEPNVARQAQAQG